MYEAMSPVLSAAKILDNIDKHEQNVYKYTSCPDWLQEDRKKMSLDPLRDRMGVEEEKRGGREKKKTEKPKIRWFTLPDLSP